MRSTIPLNVHVLILSASVFIAACFGISEKQVVVQEGDKAAALLRAGQSIFHKDHVALTQTSSASSSDIARAEEELDLHSAIDAERAELATGHYASHKAPILALAQQSSARSSDSSQELDLQLAVHAELAKISGQQSHGQWMKSPNLKSHRDTGKHQTAGLLQSGSKAHQGAKVLATTLTSKKEAKTVALSDERLDLQLAINSEIAEIKKSHGQWTKSPTPQRDTGDHQAAAFLQAGNNALQGNQDSDQGLDLQKAINSEMVEIDVQKSHGQWTKSPAPQRDTGDHQPAALLQAGHNALQGDRVVAATLTSRKQAKTDASQDQGLDLQLAIKAELVETNKQQSHGQWTITKGEHQAAVLLQAGHNALQGDQEQSHLALTGPVLKAPMVAATKGSTPDPTPPPPSLRAPLGKRAKFDAWTTEYMILGRKHHASQYFVKGFISMLVWAGLTMLIGFFYHHEKQHPPKMDPEGVNVSLHDRERLDRQRWRFGLFDCAEVPSLCLFSFFCAPIRWADTMRMAGFMNFFSALALVVGFSVLGSLTLGVGFVCLLGVCARFRLRTRKQFDIRSGLCGVYTDVLAYVFCPWCSIVQEARQVEEAYLARHASVRGEYIMARLKAAP